MDLLYGHDRKLDYLDETDMVDFLDSNMFQTPVTGFPNPEECYENDWLTSFLDDPVLNDKMMTDAVHPPCIKSEHSYSINDNNSVTGNTITTTINNGSNNHDVPGSPLGLAKCEDLDTEFFASSSALDLTMKSSSASHHKSADAIISSDAFLNASSSSSLSLSSSSLSSSSSYSSISVTKVDTDMVAPPTGAAAASTTTIVNGHHQHHSNHHHHQQPATIIVTTTSSPSLSSSAVGSSYLSADLSLPAIQIKQEPMDLGLEQNNVGLESIALPPTPPGSSGSDSEGSQSPQRSAPSSPVRYSSSLRHHHSSSPLSPSKPYSQPLFVNPISQSGVLLLSEEEKRTLISEGYPIPTKLPLTKQEEKNLKKIRRKIKNKISAQESRRKKKEYLEALEKRVEAYNHENSDLKKKVESLETSNRSLIGQLQKLQSLVKMPKGSQTGTALMVLVFCFAVFLGSMSPSSLNIGYVTKPARLGFVPHNQQQQSENQRNFYGPEMNPMLMTAHDTSDPYENDPYVTPKLKSRMLMSVELDEYCDDFRAMPWDSAPSCPMSEGDRVNHKDAADKDEYAADLGPIQVPGIDLMGGAALLDKLKTTPDTTVIMVMPGMDNNSNSDDTMIRSSVVPDVALNTKDIVPGEHRMAGNFTTEMETA